VDIIHDAPPCAHIPPARRLVASYAGSVAGLRAALRDVTLGRPTRTATALTAGGAR
jgi:hypothetical protein